MANQKRQRISNLLNKLNDEDRNALCCLLIKAGYTAKIGKEKLNGKSTQSYFVEYWEDDDNA